MCKYYYYSQHKMIKKQKKKKKVRRAKLADHWYFSDNLFKPVNLTQISYIIFRMPESRHTKYTRNE